MSFIPKAQILDNPSISIPRQVILERFDQLLIGFGSCFAQNVQEIVRRYGFRYWYDRDVCAHYSAESIADRLEAVARNTPPGDDDLCFFSNPDRVHAYTFFFKKHFYGADARERLLSRMAQLNADCRSMIQAADAVVITLGTARVMRMNRNNRLIVLMSGIPVAETHSELQTVAQTVEHLHRIVDSIRDIRGGNLPKIFFTISPQRYLFTVGVPGLEAVSPYVDNMISKSIVRAAMHEFLTERADSQLVYFPSYELVIDELRTLESLCHYDHVHVDQIHTPDYIGKRLFLAHGSDRLLRFLELSDKTIGLYHVIEDLIAGGVPEDAQHIRDKVQALVDEALGVGGADLWPRSMTMALGKILHRAGWHRWLVDLLGEGGYHPYTRFDLAVSHHALGEDETALARCREALAEMDRLPLDYPELRPRLEALLGELGQGVA